MCDCLEDPLFTEWYDEDCASSNNASSASNATGVGSITNATSLKVPSVGLFDDVDPLSILVAIVTGMAMLALIALSVLFARYRKRNAKVQSLESGIELANEEKAKAEAFNLELKRSLLRAQKEVDKVVGEAGEFLKQFKVAYAELNFGEEIGSGSYGIVWKGTFRSKNVAIKTCRVTKVTPRVVKEFSKFHCSARSLTAPLLCCSFLLCYFRPDTPIFYVYTVKEITLMVPLKQQVRAHPLFAYGGPITAFTCVLTHSLHTTQNTATTSSTSSEGAGMTAPTSYASCSSSAREGRSKSCWWRQVRTT